MVILIKAKPQSSSIKLSVRLVGLTQDPLGSSRGLGWSSTAPTGCLLGSGGLHSTAAAVLGSHPMVLVFPKCWSLCWAPPSPITFPEYSSWSLTVPHWCQALPSLMTPSVLGLPLPLSLCYTLPKLAAACGMPPWPFLEYS